MKILKRILIALFLLVIIIFIGGYIYLQGTAPNYSGEITLKGLTDEVEVRYDSYGVPHINAKNADDAYFALGYVHAQDRLFQMEMLRRAASGRLSEILGKELLSVDKLFRTLGINVFAAEHTKKFLSADTSAYQRAAFSYQKGINEFIRTGQTPLEFSIIGIPKTEFKPEDIYLANGFMAFGFAEGIRADPVLEKIKKELGPAYLSDLAVTTPSNAVRIKSFKGAPKNPVGDSLITSIGKALDKIPIPLWSGSNGWVISGSRTESGFPILANDTHIGFAQPAVWYEAQIEYPGFSMYGHHLAGIPFALLGTNQFCGWGLTMFENDDTDFFIETTKPDNPDQVKFGDTWEAVISREEIIKVKGQDDVIVSVKSTRHGPIINGIIEKSISTKTPVALSWMLNHTTNYTLQAAYQLNHATTFSEAEKSARLFSAPGLNLMYGDVDGNIAWWAVGKLPIRPPNSDSKFFLDGSSGKDEYLGIYEFSKNPKSVNPPVGYVYSANNQPDTVDGVLYPGYYYPFGRSGRIMELVSADKKWTIEETKKVNLDATSIMHPEIAKELATILKKSDKSEFATVITLLENWNGDHQLTDTAPSVYYNLLSQTLSMAMKDELGADASNTLIGSTVVKNSYHKFISNENSPWWDNVRTKDKKETRSDIVEQAALKSIALLNTTSGDKPDSWTWGKIHTITHKHVLNAVKPLNKFFNVGPFPVYGGDEVINNMDFELDTTGYYQVNSGPALRKITDFSDINSGITVSPTGQSGNVMSPHYNDQAEMFNTGQFRPMWMNQESVKANTKNLLLLKP
ncbi:penicillin acylase family protein [soil metagenome]